MAVHCKGRALLSYFVPFGVLLVCLTLKAPITTAADDIFFYFSEETSLGMSCESSAWQTIHMRCQDLFSLKNKKKMKNFV